MKKRIDIHLNVSCSPVDTSSPVRVYFSAIKIPFHLHRSCYVCVAVKMKMDKNNLSEAICFRLFAQYKLYNNRTTTAIDNKSTYCCLLKRNSDIVNYRLEERKREREKRIGFEFGCCLRKPPSMKRTQQVVYEAVM